MTVGNAITAGIIYALTELLGLSGSGHLAVVSKLFDLRITELHQLFRALLEFSVMLALLVAYRRDIAAMIRDTAGLTGFGKQARKQQRFPETRLLFMLAMATLPLLIMLPFRRGYLSLWNSQTFVGAMLLLNGGVLAVCERMLPGKKGLGKMSVPDALIVGICQAVAIIPGLSRLSVTVTCATAEGFQKGYAIRFGMLMAIPAMFGASILSLADAAMAGIDSQYLAVYFIGMGASLITGIITIYGFRRLVHRRGYGGLAYYSWVAGMLAIILALIF